MRSDSWFHLYRAYTENIPERKGSKVAINVPSKVDGHNLYLVHFIYIFIAKATPSREMNGY